MAEGAEADCFREMHRKTTAASAAQWKSSPLLTSLAAVQLPLLARI